MTVALILASQADPGLRGQLAALGVRRVDATDRGGPALRTVAAAAQVAGERVLICGGEGPVSEEILARLLRAGGTTAFTRVGAGALVVDAPDLEALAGAAGALAPAPGAPEAIGALVGELTGRGIRVRVLDAGPDGVGAVARLIVDPVVSAVAGWLVKRGLTPAALYGIALGLGLLSAVWFADPSTGAKVIAAVVLFGSLAAGRAGGVLAAAGREDRLRPAVGWLGTASGLLSEFAVYAALAASAGAGRPAGLGGVYGADLRNTVAVSVGGSGSTGVWRLAVAAMVLLGIRQIAGICREVAPAPSPNPPAGILGQVVALPAGERYALIAVTAILAGPRVTFLALLAWGVLAAGYQLARPVPGSAETTGAGGDLAACRGDGVVSRWVGGSVQGNLPPLLPVLVGLLVTGVLAALGLANLPGSLVLIPVVVMLLPALGSRHPHDGRLDWLVPPLLQIIECVFLAALGFSRHVAAVLVFALVAAVLMRHADLAYRARLGRGIPADRFGLGWDGRMLLAGLLAAVGLAPFAYAVLAGYLWLLFCWDYLSGWLSAAG
ncbi:MAG TPA: DUF5941 domain-containing protein [Streptosporangiaceae bacterium]|nr:DUF5941 domain-containing protein [Streptosporangiaceae bacterium]